MKTLRQILIEKQESARADLIKQIAKKRENDFKKKIKKICQAAGIGFEEVKIDEHNKFFELRIPLNQLIGPSTREFCADRWNTFFAQAGIEVDFRDNLNKALNSLDLLVPLRFNKENFKEIE